MRRDVVEALKELGVTMLRWPGGNFAGDYMWKDGLLPVDQRAPLKAYKPATLAYGHGYDEHEIGIDEFMALCRELGAEPSITINPVWCTPEDNAHWVEYCNGSADTEYGALRVRRGHPEPYCVRYWGLGNEMGHGHMEGPNTAVAYAELVRRHAAAMTAVCPDLELCSTGPYPSAEWTRDAAIPLSDLVKNVSLHRYFNIYHRQWDYSTSEKSLETARWIMDGVQVFRDTIHDMRRDMPRDVKIAFDEWNAWRAWFRPISTAEGILVGRTLHMLMEESVTANMPVCCYFEPVAEGAMEIRPDGCTVTAMGQMFGFMKAHIGGKICPLAGAETVDAMATLREDVMTVTLLNPDPEEEQVCTLALSGEILEARALIADSILPHSRFREAPGELRVDVTGLTVTVPPAGAVKLRVQL
jgi:alpha-N-arabinofuranosidase